MKMENGKVYHILNKSIAGYEIFNSGEDYSRIIQAIRFFSLDGTLPKFSQFIDSKTVEKKGFERSIDKMRNDGKIVDIVAYCLMPTHFHFILRQKKDDGITKFIGDLCNSYTRYFNNKYDRRGPLWQGRFKRIEVDSNEQLIDLTRYIHLNPVAAGLVKNPEEWKCSSYGEYITPDQIENPICNYEDLLDINPEEYKSFVLSRAEHQIELEKAKKRLK